MLFGFIIHLPGLTTDANQFIENTVHWFIEISFQTPGVTVALHAVFPHASSVSEKPL